MKMKTADYIITALILSTLVLAVSCKEKAIEIDSLEKEIFLRETREGLYRNGKAMFLYQSELHQKATNPRRIQYRRQTDEQDTCLNVAMDALPESPGVHITTSIDYRSPGDLISNMSHLECSRIYEDKIWLWNSGSLTGLILNISQLR